MVTPGSNISVSIIIPCRNEKIYINKVLDSILFNDFPKDRLEVIVADGMSNDGTKDVILKYTKEHNFIRIIDNLKKIVPCALNEGIRQAQGEIIMRMDAHAEYPSNYITKLVTALNELKSDNVGGAWIILPGAPGVKAKAIAIVVSHPFGIGNATYRWRNLSGHDPIEVDTVPFGCFRKGVFDRVGLFDEELVRNQDNEFNERLKKRGGRIFLIPDLKIKYYARDSYRKLWKMFYQYGKFGPLVDKKLGRPTRLRRYVPSIFIISLFFPTIIAILWPKSLLVSLASLLLYFLTNLSVSAGIAYKKREIGLFPLLSLAFLITHLSYGFGYLMGSIDFWIFKKNPNIDKITITR